MSRMNPSPAADKLYIISTGGKINWKYSLFIARLLGKRFYGIPGKGSMRLQPLPEQFISINSLKSKPLGQLPPSPHSLQGDLKLQELFSAVRFRFHIISFRQPYQTGGIIYASIIKRKLKRSSLETFQEMQMGSKCLSPYWYGDGEAGKRFPAK